MRRKMISKASLARRCRGLGFFIFFLRKCRYERRRSLKESER